MSLCTWSHHLVEAREPHIPFGAHVVEQFEDRLAPGEAARQCRMPDRDPQCAKLSGRVELTAEDPVARCDEEIGIRQPRSRLCA
jgi:hypothetical protein